MGGKRLLLWTLLLVLLVSSVHAKTGTGHLKLLAVTESGDVMRGSVADLYLEVSHGSGRVFIDTFPLTKVDTQISTRFAKQLACDYIDVDCDRYDFIYTIRSGSSIIGGPSAGAALTTLTVAVLKGYPIDETVTITGTINSGGIVGNVGGVKEKIEAAADAGLTKALIPDGEQMHETDDNQTIDLVPYGEELGIDVIPISEIDQAVFEVTGKITKKKAPPVEIDNSYQDTMKFLATDLCARGEELLNDINQDELVVNTTESILYDAAQNLSGSGLAAYNVEDYYSSASFCFGANIRYNHIGMLQDNVTLDDVSLMNFELQSQIQSMHDSIRNINISTITDLEAYMVVTDRLAEALVASLAIDEEISNSLDNDAIQSTITNETNVTNTTPVNVTRITQTAIQNLAFVTERFKSAEAWSTFFGKPGKEFIFDDSSLAFSCQEKLAEVEERVQYVRFFLPGFMSGEHSQLQEAYNALSVEEYAMCLFRASKAKAEANIVLSAMGTTENRLFSLLERKQNAVMRTMSEQTQNNIFPILGYSYYEYSKSLGTTDVQSALLYSEYALELSRMDMYFQEKEGYSKYLKHIDWDIFKIFITGALFGIVSGILITAQFVAHKKKVLKKKRSKKRKDPWNE